MELQKLVINRLKWLRGEGADVSYLLRASDGKMCCLGFHARQIAKLPAKEISGACNPLEAQGSWFYDDRNGNFSRDARDLMQLNDAILYESEAEREAAITAIFLKHNIEVEFIN